MKQSVEYFPHTIPGLMLASARAYEIVKPHENGEVERLGWVIETDTGGETHWVAWAVLSATGDSFLGSFKGAHGAVVALHDNEKELEKQRVAADPS